MKPEVNNTFCFYPFRQIALKDFQGSQLEMAWPCCMMGNKTSIGDDSDKLKIPNINSMQPDEIFNHPRMQQLRTNLLDGIKDSACQICWEQESKGVKTFRFSSELHSTTIDLKNPTLTSIDITNSRECNLRCRMCSPVSSNQLMKDYKFFEEHSLLTKFYSANTGRWKSNNSLLKYSPTDSIQWDWLMNNTDKIKYIQVSGGEPFYDSKTIKLIDRYIETGAANDATLCFITNGTMFTPELMEKLNQFKANDHSISIDGYGLAYEYIRYPSTFSGLEKSLKTFLDLSTTNKKLLTSIVVSSLNVASLVDYVKWLREFAPGSTIIFTEILPSERGTSLFRMPIYLLQQALDQLAIFDNNDNEITNLRNLIAAAIKNNREDKQKMLNEIEPFDLSRNQYFGDFLDPALVEWLERKD